jgi:hypothetical protein
MDLFSKGIKEPRKATKFLKRWKPVALSKKVNSYISGFQVLSKVLLIGVIIGVVFFLVVRAVPIAQWIAHFLTGIYLFFLRSHWLYCRATGFHLWLDFKCNRRDDGLDKKDFELYDPVSKRDKINVWWFGWHNLNHF